MKRLLTNESGSALLIALALTAMLSMLAILAIDNSNTEMELAYNKVHKDQSFYVAEAGVQHAHAMVTANKNWNAGFSNMAFGDGAYSVVVRDSSIDPSLADSVLVLSEGIARGSKSRIEATLIPEPFYPFRYGLFADSALSIDNSVSTDSYNADSGSYAQTKTDTYGSVGSNGTVTLENNPTIAGDVSSATADGITITGSGTVLGDTTTTAPTLDYSNLIAPDQFSDASLLNRAPLGMSGSFDFNLHSNDLRVHHDQKMVLETGIYVFDDITLEQNAQIELAPGAQVEIYVTGDVLMRNKSTVNFGGKPADFQLYSNGTSFMMEQSTSFTGAVIAPNVDFSLNNYAEFFGGMMANTISLRNNPRFHYDRSLWRIQMGTTGRIIRVAWRELD